MYVRIMHIYRENEADKETMIADLHSGKYDALVLDSPVLEYTVGTNEACDLFTVGEPFETFSLALAFPSDYNDSQVFDFSSSIVKLQVGSSRCKACTRYRVGSFWGMRRDASAPRDIAM